MSGKVIHRSKFQAGRMSPQEFHLRYGMRKACVYHPDRAAVIRIKVFMPLKELLDRAPTVSALIKATSPDGSIPAVDFRGSDGRPVKYVKVSDIGACWDCRTTAELTAARDAPSWAVVEIDRGPNPTARVQVGEG